MIEEDRLAAYYRAADILQEAGYTVNVRDRYGGRGYFEGPGIVSNAPPAIIGGAVMAAILQDMNEDEMFDWQEAVADILREEMPRRQDSMGLDVIVY